MSIFRAIHMMRPSPRRVPPPTCRYHRVPHIVVGVVDARVGASTSEEDLERSPRPGWGIHLASGKVVTTADIRAIDRLSSDRLQVWVREKATE